MKLSNAQNFLKNIQNLKKTFKIFLFFSEKEYSAALKALNAKKRPENERRLKEKRNSGESVKERLKSGERVKERQKSGEIAKERLDNGKRVQERQEKIEDWFCLENLALKPQPG